MRGCELYIPAARRFANVEEVKVLCFMEHTGNSLGPGGNSGDDIFSLSQDVSNRTMPFLGTFAKLARVLIGGLDSERDLRIFNSYHITDFHWGRRSRSNDVFKHLLTAYVGAIKSGSLPRKIALEGLELCDIDRPLCRQKYSDCEWCRDILSHYPLNDLLRFLVDNERRTELFCQTEQEQWDVVRRRPDADKAFSEVSEEVLCNEVRSYKWPAFVRNEFGAAAVENLPEKWRLAARQCEHFSVYFISRRNFRRIDDLIEKGFNPKYVTRKVALETWRFGASKYTFGSRFYTCTRTTVENLAARGFPVDCECIPVIDDKYIGEYEESDLESEDESDGDGESVAEEEPDEHIDEL